MQVMHKCQCLSGHQLLWGGLTTIHLKTKFQEGSGPKGTRKKAIYSLTWEGSVPKCFLASSLQAWSLFLNKEAPVLLYVAHQPIFISLLPLSLFIAKKGLWGTGNLPILNQDLWWWCQVSLPQAVMTMDFFCMLQISAPIGPKVTPEFKALDWTG